MSDFVLEFENVTKKYGEVTAVDSISLRVKRGEVFGFLGPNGSGKTTSIGMALGLLHASSGNIRVLGHEVTPLRNSVLSRVGSLVGTPAMVPYLSGRENVALAAQAKSVPHAAVVDILDRVGLSHAAGRLVREYSLGMKQRLGLAVALLGKPELLILDEPTNGLDPAGMKDIRQLILALAIEGVTVFLSSHLLNEIEQVCDSVAVLNKGRLIAHGSVAELIGGEPEVQVKVPDAAEAARLLAELPEARNIRVNQSTLTVSGISNETVVAFLVARGVIPREVSTKQLDLESIFLDMTRKDEPIC